MGPERNVLNTAVWDELLKPHLKSLTADMRKRRAERMGTLKGQKTPLPISDLYLMPVKGPLGQTSTSILGPRARHAHIQATWNLTDGLSVWPTRTPLLHLPMTLIQWGDPSSTSFTGVSASLSKLGMIWTIARRQVSFVPDTSVLFSANWIAGNTSFSLYESRVPMNDPESHPPAHLDPYL